MKFHTSTKKALPTVMVVSLLGCGLGATGAGKLVVALEPELPSPLTASGDTVTVTTLLLSVEEIEVLGGEGTTEHSHDEHDPEEEGSLEVHVPGAVIDLTGGEVVMTEEPAATAGEYTEVYVNVAPAAAGPASGHTLLAEGSVTDGVDTRTFAIHWDEEVTDFVKLEGDIHLENEGAVEVLLAFDVATLFQGIDFFAATASGDHVTVDATTNAPLLTTIRANLAAAFALEVHGDEHDH